jgi:prolyl oligopeptidase
MIMMKPLRDLPFVFCLLVLAAKAQTPAIPAPPDTPKRPVTDEYHGVQVADNYRWLENWDDPEVKQWSAGQNARTRAYFDQLSSRPAIKARLKALISGGSASYYNLQYRAGVLFGMKEQPPRQQSMLVTLRSADDPASTKIVFDPNAASALGSLAVDYFVPSFDGKYVAAALSKNGSEDAEGHVFEVVSGKELPDRVPRVNFATGGGSIAWKADASGFYYTRYPQGNERAHEDANFYQQVYFHKLGTDAAQDTYVIGKEFPRIAEIQLRASGDGRWLLAAVANGDGGQFAHYLMDASGRWTQLTHFEDGIVSVKFATGQSGAVHAVYLLSRKDAPRGQILALPLAHPDLAQAKIVVPQSSGGPKEERASIRDFILTEKRLYVVDIVGGPSRLRVFDLMGKPLALPSFPAIADISSGFASAGGDALFSVSTYVEPPAWYRVDATTGKAVPTRLFETSLIRYDDVELRRAFATSKDGTRVPMTIIVRKRTKLDGNNPALLYGYGGYGISQTPRFLEPQYRLWLDAGGVVVQSNLRGGAEYGEEWHQAGHLTHKQNVFDDFIACAQYLIDQKYTSPQRLAILGGSNGGLLMGAAFTEHPEMFRAAVSLVGIYDMLRVELDPNGQFNIPEVGTVQDPEQFKALYAYSPYHHVEDGTAYPAILMPTGENDHRVNPMESRKMVARLQAADSSGHPILLRTSATTGHGGIGASLDDRLELQADILSFLFDQLGMHFPVETGTD